MGIDIANNKIEEVSYARCRYNDCDDPDNINKDLIVRLEDAEAIPTREQSWEIVKNIPEEK